VKGLRPPTLPHPQTPSLGEGAGGRSRLFAFGSIASLQSVYYLYNINPRNNPSHHCNQYQRTLRQDRHNNLSSHNNPLYTVRLSTYSLYF